MFPYILLIVTAFLFSFVAVAPMGNKRGMINVTRLKIGSSDYIGSNNVSLFWFFLIFFLLLSFRDISIGRDVSAYKFYFEQYSNMSLNTILKIEGDVLYAVLNWIVSKVTDNYQIFLSLVAAMTLWPIYRQYRTDKRYSFMKVVLFMNMTTFIMFFSGLRQSIAIGMGMIAYEFVKKKKILPFIVTVVIAMGFHHSAFVLFLLYPFYYMHLKKTSLVIIVPLTTLIFVFNKPIFRVLVDVLNRLSGGQYEADIISTGAFSTIVLFAMFLALAYFIPDEKAMDEETMGLRNILILSLWLQCFAPLHSLAMRFNYYFIIFRPMVIPKVLSCSRVRYKKIAKVVGIVIITYLLYYYLSHTYRACVNGISALDTYPYVPFWSK